MTISKPHKLMCCCLLLFSTGSFGQQEAEPEAAKFEAAVITAAREPSNGPSGARPNDNALLTIQGLSLKHIISRAYDVAAHHILRAGFEFIDSEYFNITAKIPENVSRDRVPEMLRNLLEDRFGLVARIERRTVNGYTLTVADTELLRTRAANPTDRPPSDDRSLRYIFFPNSSMRGLARGLTETFRGIPVADGTKIDGTYTLWVEIAGDDASGVTAETLESLARYGLRLQKGKVAADYLTVERINRKPTEN